MEQATWDVLLMIVLGLFTFGVWSLGCVGFGAWIGYRRDSGKSPVPKDLQELFSLFRAKTVQVQRRAEPAAKDDSKRAKV